MGTETEKAKENIELLNLQIEGMGKNHEKIVLGQHREDCQTWLARDEARLKVLKTIWNDCREIGPGVGNGLGLVIQTMGDEIKDLKGAIRIYKKNGIL